MSAGAYALLALATAAACVPWYVAVTATTELPGLAMLLGSAALYVSYKWFDMLREDLI